MPKYSRYLQSVFANISFRETKSKSSMPHAYFHSFSQQFQCRHMKFPMKRPRFLQIFLFESPWRSIRDRKPKRFFASRDRPKDGDKKWWSYLTLKKTSDFGFLERHGHARSWSCFFHKPILWIEIWGDSADPRSAFLLGPNVRWFHPAESKRYRFT